MLCDGPKREAKKVNEELTFYSSGLLLQSKASSTPENHEQGQPPS